MPVRNENIYEKLRRRKLTLGVYRNACGSGGDENIRDSFASTAVKTLLF